MVGENFGAGQVFYSILWFTLFFIWIWLLIIVFSDIFRSHDMNGWAKFFWTLFVIVFPYLGVFVYLIARGGKMSQHAQEDAARIDAAQKSYIRNAVGEGSSPADQLQNIATLRDTGVIDDEEFNKMKAKIVG